MNKLIILLFFLFVGGFTSAQTITLQPRDTTICWGDTAIFKIETDGGENSKDWQSSSDTINWVFLSIDRFELRVLDSSKVYRAVIDGNIYSDTISLSYYTLSNVNASAVDTILCLGDTLDLMGSSTSTDLVWNWEGTDNFSSTSTLNGDTINIPIVGSYEYILTISDTLGCQNTDTLKNIIVHDLPNVNASAVDTILCLGDTLDLMGSSTSTDLVWNWEGTDNFSSTSTLNGDTINIPIVGSYEYILTISDTLGCQNTDTLKNIIVHDLPNVNASAVDTILCLGDTLDLMGSSTSTDLVWNWEGTDNFSSTSTLNGDTINIPIVGSYEYILTISDTLGCQNTDTLKNIIVHDLPNVNASAVDTILCLGDTLDLMGSSTSTDLVWNWEGTDNFSSTSTLNGDTINIPIVGSYEYILTISDTLGCQNTDTLKNIIVHDLPNVNASAVDTILCLGDTLDLMGSSTSTDLVWNWEGTDNFSSTSTLNGDTINIPIVGSYEYILTISDTLGCQNTDTLKNIIVHDLPNVNASAVDTILCLGDTLDLMGSSTSTDLVWNWEGTDNFSSTSTLNGDTINIPIVGSYEYILTISDTLGCQNTDTLKNIIVHDLPNVNASAVDTILCLGDTLDLMGSSTSTDLVWNWEGTDNFSSTSTLNGDTINIPIVGSYEYILTISDTLGCQNTDTLKNIIVHDLPNVNASAVDTILCLGDTLDLMGSSTSTDLVWNWEGTDNFSSTSTLNGDTINIPIVGSYEYILTISDTLGCQNTDTLKNIIVHDLPNVNASAVDTILCLGDTLDLMGSSTSTDLVWNWEGTDNFSSTSTLNGDTINIPIVGSYEYILTISDTLGCQNTDTLKNIIVHDLPNVNASAVDTILCLGDTLDLMGSSTSTDLVWNWEGTDNFSSTSTLNGDTINIPIVGSYEYILTISDTLGCQNTDTLKNIIVHDLPNVNASAVDTILCLGDTLDLMGSSTSTDLVWNWEGTDNFSSTSTLNGDTINIPIVGSYEYILTISDTLGCQNTDTLKNIIVHDLPNVNASAVDTILCDGERLNLFGSSTNTISSWVWNSTDGFNSTAQDTSYIPTTGLHTYTLTVVDALTKCIDNNSIDITINTLPEPIIIGEDEICENERFLLYKIANSVFNSAYTWSVGNNTIASDRTDSIYVHWDGNITNVITEEEDVNGCKNTDTLYITNKGIAPVPDSITKKTFGSNVLLIYKDSTLAFYQWGYLDKTTNLDVELTGETDQYLLLNSTAFNPIDKYYWVETSNEGFENDNCFIRIYYNEPSWLTTTNSKVEFLNDNVLVYPNPSNGQFNLRFNQSLQDVEVAIINNMGQVIQQTHFYKIFTEKNYQFNITTNSSGLYIIRLYHKTSKTVSYKKLLILN